MLIHTNIHTNVNTIIVIVMLKVLIRNHANRFSLFTHVHTLMALAAIHTHSHDGTAFRSNFGV